MQDARNYFEGIISSFMTVSIVELLEVIDIDDQQRQRKIVALCNSALMLEKLIKVAAVFKPG